jgi:hypothetical protein
MSTAASRRPKGAVFLIKKGVFYSNPTEKAIKV